MNSSSRGPVGQYRQRLPTRKIKDILTKSRGSNSNTLRLPAPTDWSKRSGSNCVQSPVLPETDTKTILDFTQPAGTYYYSVLLRAPAANKPTIMAGCYRGGARNNCSCYP